MHFRTIEVKDILEREIGGLSYYSSIKKALDYSIRNSVSNVPIVDEDNILMGYIPKGTLLDEIANIEKPVAELLSKDIDRLIVLDSTNAQLIDTYNHDELFVVDDKMNFLGVVRRVNYYSSELSYMNNYFSTVFNASNQGIISIDKNGSITRFNHVAEDIFNVKERDVLGSYIRDIIPYSLLPKVINDIKTEINQIVYIDTKKIMVSRGPLIEKGEVVGAIEFLLDISENDALVKKLEEQRHLSNVLNTVLETVYDGIIVVNDNGIVTMISKTYKQFLGYADKQIIGKHVTEIVENTRMHIVVKTGIPEIADIQKIKGSYMVASRIPMWENGKIVGAVGKVLFRNVAELNSLHNKISMMEQKIEEYKGELKSINSAKYRFEDIIGISKKVYNTKCLGMKASKTSSNVLIQGESGTGKELLSHAIHNLSDRAYGPFIKVNCAAIPNELMESELFGYEEGAFTGAKKGGKIGKFELANGGTIFLDEIGDMPIYMQSKLLRVIQEREIERIGSSRTKKIDVRIISATNKNLEELVDKDEFRNDLYYRLNVFSIKVPSLRERPEDIRPLSEYFLDKLNTKYMKKTQGVSDIVMNSMIGYSWPGNIRELENIIERAVNLVEYNGVIDIKHIPIKVTSREYVSEETNLKDIVERIEKQTIIRCLKITKGNRSKAAGLLGVGRTTFYEKLERYNLK